MGRNTLYAHGLYRTGRSDVIQRVEQPHGHQGQYPDYPCIYENPGSDCWPPGLKLEIEEIKKKLSNHSKNIELVFDYLDKLIEKKETPKPRKQIGYKK